MTRTLGGFTAAALVLASASCTYRAPEPLAARVARYLTANPQTSAELGEAIRQGRVLAGMDREQVLAAVGPPERATRLEGPSKVEVWIYYAARFPGSQPGSGRTDLFRVVFVDARVRIVEPI